MLPLVKGFSFLFSFLFSSLLFSFLLFSALLFSTLFCSFFCPFLDQDLLCLMETHTDMHQRRMFSVKNPHFLFLPLNMEQTEHIQCKSLLLTTCLQLDFDTSSLKCGTTFCLSCFQMGLPRRTTCSAFLEANTRTLETGLRSTNVCQGKAV